MEGVGAPHPRPDLPPGLSQARGSGEQWPPVSHGVGQPRVISSFHAGGGQEGDVVPAATVAEATEATEEEGEEEEEDAQKVEEGGESGEEGGGGAVPGPERGAGCGGRGIRTLGAALCPAASVGRAGVGGFFPFPLSLPFRCYVISFYFWGLSTII